MFFSEEKNHTCVHGLLITWLNDSLFARVYENSMSENKKNQTHSESFICVRVINKIHLGLNNTHSGSTY